MEREPNIMRYTTHPLLLIAAIAVVLFCGVGIAAVMGWLPQSGAKMGPPVAEAPLPVAAHEMGPPPAPAGYAPLNRVADTSGYSGGGANAGSYGGGAAPSERNAPEARYAEAQAPAPAPAPAACHSCGVVEAVKAVTQRGQGSGLGAAGGALVGGLLGNQVGGGNGRKLATVAGAVGGAVVGNQVEGNMKSTTTYQVRVRMDDGKVRTVSSSSANWQAGDHVKVVKGRLQRR
ncbi:Glycine zipper 2TM domain-containing protein [Duganella sp. CF458]|uniref:glycine zipper 2TM domain-containing protein n=1 Tax=Duganella sp. CF458 TaxID=1884368 RepID=UPI0008E5C90A|nr:glycine zipper 2TM domain-containing protein [Duganella sp. CF458]SFF82786.1 Glycine zipper 2TM domain-containing protein [Duganella sp. CF458]